MKIDKLTPVKILDAIKYGDYIEDDLGQSGLVERIDRVSFRAEIHYYFKLSANKGTVIILK
ncbi:hypothetical protein [Pedobacter sp.]|uniref:hypothetical protein n=1 Tax=Pedobacter sp. TaxID=1411316 RepID=UPI003BAA8C2C